MRAGKNDKIEMFQPCTHILQPTNKVVAITLVALHQSQLYFVILFNQLRSLIFA